MLEITSKQIQKKRDGMAQILIKFHGQGTTQGTVYVATDGWDKDKWENRSNFSHGGYRGKCTTGKQIRFAINGPLLLEAHEWEFLVENINQAYNEVVVLNS